MSHGSAKDDSAILLDRGRLRKSIGATRWGPACGALALVGPAGSRSLVGSAGRGESETLSAIRQGLGVFHSSRQASQALPAVWGQPGAMTAVI